MNKLAKRISALVTMLLMVLMLIPAEVSAAAVTGEEKNVIYVQVPSDWEGPCVWAWDDAGNNAFEAWPGEAAEPDSANEGWYYIHIPEWANHVIVNANEGSVQTEEQLLDGGNVWITVNAADDVAVSYEQQTTGDIPEYVEMFVVHAQVDSSWENPCIWAWSAPDGTNAFENWPGYALSDDGDGWYSAKIPTWVNSIIINGNEGTVQTEDMSIDAAEIWVTVNAEGAAAFSYVDPNQESVPDITVHVIAPSDWDSPCLWAWSAPDGTNVYSTWPGEALDEGESGWLVKDIPGWVNSIIVNGNEGSVQTADISIDTGKDVWVVVTDAENYEVTYEEPVVDTEVETETVAEEPETENEASSNTTLIVIIVIVVVVLAAAVIVVVIKRKK